MMQDSIERWRQQMGDSRSYQPKQFNLSGLNGISDQTLEMHFKLYEGYVKETNRLGDKISEFLKADFVSIGKMRGVGWAICYQDPVNQTLSNHWITLHEVGNVAGFNPVLVMDVWEHAYLLDYKPAERPKYIEAFMSNVDWSAFEDRL